MTNATLVQRASGAGVEAIESVECQSKCTANALKCPYQFKIPGNQVNYIGPHAVCPTKYNQHLGTED